MDYFSSLPPRENPFGTTVHISTIETDCLPTMCDLTKSQSYKIYFNTCTVFVLVSNCLLVVSSFEPILNDKVLMLWCTTCSCRT